MLNTQGQMPIIVLKEGTRREHGKDATFNNITAAKTIADSVRSTLGPRGMDKMLVSSLGDVIITNDGVTILKEMDVEHPAAKMIIETAKIQDEECRDGTTTAVVLAGEFLKHSEELLDQHVHPTLITSGFRMALDFVIEQLDKLAETIKPDDEETLRDIAMTSMTGKSAEGVKEHLAEIAVKAVIAVKEESGDRTVVDLDNVKVLKRSGAAVLDSELIDGLILDSTRVHSGMPNTLKNAKIALLNSALELKKTEVEAKIQITSPTQLQDFINEEENMLRKMVETIQRSGANVVFCQKGIGDLSQHFLAKAGIYALKSVKESDLEKLAKATGGRILNNLSELSSQDLGKAKLVREKKVGEDDMTFVTGCKNTKAVSILIRGGTEHVTEEIERNLNDALGVVAITLEDGKVVTGGGAALIELSSRLKDYANTIGGREQLAIEAYANAIEVVPRTLAENAGLDPLNSIIELRKAHKKGGQNSGINIWSGLVVDMKKLRVIEPLRLVKQALLGATETAIMILRIDDVISSKRGSGMGPGVE